MHKASDMPRFVIEGPLVEVGFRTTAVRPPPYTTDPPANNTSPPSPQSKPESPTLTFRLLSLPPEIRNLIYDHSLIVSQEIIAYPSRAEEEEVEEQGTSATSSHFPNLALLLTNRQIWQEARPCLYGKNIWRLSYQTQHSHPQDGWDLALPPLWTNNAPLFRHISMRFDHRDLVQVYRSAIASMVLKRDRERQATAEESSSSTSGNPSKTTAAITTTVPPPTALELENTKRKVYEDMFVVLCAQKLSRLEEIEEARGIPLRSITLELEGVRHPCTLEREGTLARVVSVLWQKWDFGGEKSTRAEFRDPRTWPHSGTPWVGFVGLEAAEEERLFL
ncbi:MAG: hypothetical protein LQ346_006643 [Caloplaca aetnensis]|nr:MAG: hypothetical protein LQ346_006643 [Caloplaca aetnensis]